MNAQQILSVSVTPVVLISACGLITLALYNRLGVILARIRALHQQKIDLLKSRQLLSGIDQRQLLELIDSQSAKVTDNAAMIQRGLACLLGACLAFLVCSCLTAASAVIQSLGFVALIAHFVGLTLFACGLGWALKEIRRSLTPLQDERNCLDSWTDERGFPEHHNENEHFTQAA